MTMSTKPESWMTAAKEKIALHKMASSSKDDQAVTEAFAQQAYTAIGNRDREIMRDPYLLGFEVVDKNEDNTRLVGSFCFRVGGEILLAPVFYLNGQIKGQNLLYRKSKNRFCPNTDKWVAYLLGQAEDEEGRGISKQRGSRDSRMNLGLDRLVMPPGYKYASQDRSGIEWDAAKWKSASAEERGARIKEIYKEAQTDIAGADLNFMFRDMLVDLDMGKEAAVLAEKHLPFAEMIEKGGLLSHSKAAGVQLKEGEEIFFREPVGASEAEKQALYSQGYVVVKKAEVVLTLHTEPAEGMSENEIEELYKRSFSLEDKRPKINLNTAVRKEETVQSWSSLNQPGVHRAIDVDGEKVKVLWAPEIDSYSTCNSICSPPSGGDKRRDDYALLFLDGKDKGSMMTFGGHVGENNLPIFSTEGEDPIGDDDLPKGSKPKVGSAYLIYLPAEKRVFGPVAIASLAKKGGDTLINHEVVEGGKTTMKMVVKGDLEVSTLEDFAPEDYRMPRILGDDAIFIEVEGNKIYRHASPETNSNIVGFEPSMPASFRPLTLAALNRVLTLGKSATVELRRDARLPLYDILQNGKPTHRELSIVKLAAKLAVDLALSGEDATAFAEEVRDNGKVAFDLVPNKAIRKMAATYYKSAEEINPESVKDKTQVEKGDEPFTGTPGEKEKKKEAAGELGKSLPEIVSGPLGASRTGAAVGGLLGTVGKGVLLGGGAYAGYRGAKRLIDGPKEKEEKEEEDSKKEKEAAAWFDRELHPDSGDFDNYGYDEDIQAPIVEDYNNAHSALAVRERMPRPPGNYMDSWQPIGGRNPRRQEDFVPDDVLLSLVNPAEELAQIGESMGKQQLIDHGAVASMCKVFDAKPYISNYVGELEKSIDYLARLLFMFYWKPRDFATLFGSDDLPNMENKLIGVYEAYGDMVLELLQSVGDKID